jgi:hypothetical protein
VSQRRGTKHVYEEQQLQASALHVNRFTNLASLSTELDGVGCVVLRIDGNL